MKHSIRLVAIAAFICSVGAAAQSVVTIDLASAGKPIPENFAGLSFETSSMLPGTDGRYAYFTPGNQKLIQLFHTLGVRSLRIGGNTSDRPSVAVPKTADIDQLFGFARKADASVIYTLRLRDSTASSVQQTAKYVMDRYASQIDCLVVGNEPNVYEHTYPRYAADLKAFYPAVLAVASKARFCGPSTTPGAGAWVNGYIKDFGTMPQLYQVTQHAYPGGNSRRATDPAAARAAMLSPAFEKSYQHLYDAFVPNAIAAGVKYRIEETNSFYNGGAKDVSNTFASSLWALSYLYWWLDHDAQGVNFHTGDQVAAGEVQTPCWYATFWNTPTGLDVHPIAYALAAFHLASAGRLAHVDVSPAPAGVEVFATFSPAHEIYVTLINKNFGAQTQPVKLRIALPSGYFSAETMELDAPGGNVAATTGIRLGGAPIQSDGSWAGSWSRTRGGKRSATVVLPAASAVVVRLGTSGK